MTDQSKDTGNTSKGLWARLRRPSAHYSILALLVAGFASGIVFWGGFNTGMEATNELEFCIGCHEMRDNVYQEYTKTIHYTNRTGTTVTSADCHVPSNKTPCDYGHKVMRNYFRANGRIGRRNRLVPPRNAVQHLSGSWIYRIVWSGGAQRIGVG